MLIKNCRRTHAWDIKKLTRRFEFSYPAVFLRNENLAFPFFHVICKGERGVAIFLFSQAISVISVFSVNACVYLLGDPNAEKKISLWLDSFESTMLY